MLGPGKRVDSHGAAAAIGSTGEAMGEALQAYAIGVFFMSPATIIESPLFTRLWPDYWTQAEHADFIDHVLRTIAEEFDHAQDPPAGRPRRRP